jgi:hypothetical protein
MIPGFNHNIKHKGRVYHVQTEDSGIKNPHIITHLFVGGNIVASNKTQYADLVQQADFEVRVRAMMEDQHKAMLRNLINGAYDQVDVGKAFHLDGPAPLNFTAVSPNTNAMAGSAAFKGLPSQLSATSSTAAMAAPLPTPAAQVIAPLPKTATPLPKTATPLPKTATPLPMSATPRPNRPIGATVLADAVSRPPMPAEDRRSATTIFGEDLISEKSLDEVILSYLAEDLSDLE